MRRPGAAPESSAVLVSPAAAITVPGGARGAQSWAWATCSAVRVSDIARISASPARNSGDPNAGGGSGRNWAPEVRKNGRVP